MAGGDAEVGWHLTRSLKNDFYIGAGPYAFTADPNGFWGGKARVYWRYKDFFSLEASYSYDHIFKNIVQGTVSLSYPFGAKIKRKGEGCPKAEDLSLARAAFAPYRFEIPVVEVRKSKHTARDPGSGKPINFWFVNNTSHSEGTIESPFPTLAQAEAASGPNDVIYVYPGDGTDSGMNSGITLQDGQKLFGSGMVQHLRTKEGKIRIPAHSKTAPTISNAGTVVTLANANEVSGFFIVDTANAGFAIIGTSSNGAYIHNNVITTGFGAINIQGFGNLTVRHNVLTATGNPNVTNSNGIFITPMSGQFANIDVSYNQISNIGFAVIIQPAFGQTSTSNVDISNNFIQGFGFSGIAIANGVQTARITNNVINDTISTGAAIPGAGSIALALSNPGNAGSYVIDNNIITTTTTTASTRSIAATSGAIAIESARISVTNNTISTGLGSGDSGIFMGINGSSAVFCTTITGNQVTLLGTNMTNGMNISATAPAAINIDDFSNNIANDIVMSGVNLVPLGTCGQ